MRTIVTLEEITGITAAAAVIRNGDAVTVDGFPGIVIIHTKNAR